MKRKNIENLKEGDKIWHLRYGVCEVTGYIPDFGPTINPINQQMKGLLVYDSGAEFDTPLLETEFDNIKKLKQFTNQEKIELIKRWQKNDNVHSLTCGNDSSHSPLYAIEENEKVVLKCPDCDYVQNWVPEILYQI